MPLSNEAQLAVLVERMDGLAREMNGRLDSLRIDTSEHRAITQQLEERVREQNGRVRSLEADNAVRSELWKENLKFQDTITKGMEAMISRLNAHDAWHGPSDTAIAARVQVLEDAKTEAEKAKGFEEGRHSMLVSQWRMLSSVAGISSALTAVVSKLAGIW